MEEIKKEKVLKNSTGPIFIKTAENIIYQMKNCLCKIKCKDGGSGSGFFCKIPYPDQSHLLPVLVTTDFIIDFTDVNKNGKCEYCGTIFNAENYDWILTSIEV